MRIAVLADIQGNVLALDAVLNDLQERGGAELIVNLGDCVSGPLWPRETLERLQELNLPTVRGNHDRRVARDPLDDTMGPSDRYAHDRLTAAQREMLFALPLTLEVAPGVVAFHARPDHDEKYLADAIVDGRLVRAPLAAIRRRLKALDPACRMVLCGHSHRTELIRIPEGPVIFNPGSVGCPAYHSSDSGACLRARLRACALRHSHAGRAEPAQSLRGHRRRLRPRGCGAARRTGGKAGMGARVANRLHAGLNRAAPSPG